MDHHELRVAQQIDSAKRTADALSAKLREAKRAVREAEAKHRSARKSRTWHLCALGAPLHARGFTGEDAAVIEGLLASSASSLQRAIDDILTSNEAATVADVYRAVAQQHAATLTKSGDAVIWNRQKRKYDEDCARWNAAEKGVTSDWRRKRATKEQEWLIVRVAEQSQLPLPTCRSRGGAYDWLVEHGGNIRLAGKSEAGASDE